MSVSTVLGHLPNRAAKLVLVSGEYLELAESLQQLGVNVLVTTADKRLPGPVQWHPDMQACAIGNEIIVSRDSGLMGILLKHGISVSETLDLPEPNYPNDVLCNVLSWDKWAMGNLKTADKSIQKTAKQLGLTWINVKQGYASCSTVLVDEQSAITADKGVADQMERHGIQVLRVSNESIRLPGYSYGFIGGCCGKLAPNIMVFMGSLDNHPSGVQIRKFLSVHGVEPVELFDGKLLDVGGLMALC